MTAQCRSSPLVAADYRPSYVLVLPFGRKTKYPTCASEKVVEMKKDKRKKEKFKGKKAPLFFSCLYLILCFVSIFSIDPVLWFLKYAALFGVLTGILLIAYIIRTDEL